MFKKIILIFVIALTTVLVGCGKKTAEATSYGIVGKEYVGIANVTVKDGVVEKITFDEVFLPTTFAKINKLEGEVPEDVIVGPKDDWYAKYIKLGDKKFTAFIKEDNSLSYSAEGITDLMEWLNQSEENCKWYVNTVTKEKVILAKSDWTESDYQSLGYKTSEGKLGFTKSKTNYWPAGEYGLGWKTNITEIEKVIKGTKLNATDSQIIKGGTDNKYWVVNGVVSGATITGFKDYYNLAKKAYNKITK